jgi:hypothetical protein
MEYGWLPVFSITYSIMDDLVVLSFYTFILLGLLIPSLCLGEVGD